MKSSKSAPDILRKIARVRRRRLGESLGARLLDERIAKRGELLRAAENDFLAALVSKRGRAVIAEIKMGSPRLGSLAESVDAIRVAETYGQRGAAALSVVVEPDFFFGSYDLLKTCRQASGLPAIAKDFVVDPLQLRWARDAGASAVLLIASLYSRKELGAFAAMARHLGLVPLVEVHDLLELDKLGGASWELVGVNNRNLHTFEVEIENSLALLPSLPTDSLKVAESGISTRQDLDLLRGAGFDAFLIGESLLLADDPAVRLQEYLA